MESHSGFRYITGHETPRIRTSAGKAPPTGNPAVKSGKESVGSSTGLDRFGEFRFPLVSGLQKAWAARTAAAANARASTQVVETGEEQARKVALERSHGRRLPDRPLDFAACGRGDRGAFSSSLSPLPCVEAFDRAGLELPDTRAPGVATKGGRDCLLEAPPVAPYKKTLSGWERISFFWMNPAFCSSPTSPEHGPPRGKPLCSTISTSSIGFRHSALWLSPPREDALPSTLCFVVAISQAWTQEPSSKTCSETSGDLLSFCGMEEPSTCAKKSKNTSVSIPGFMLNVSLPMRRNSIRLNMCGIRPIVPSLILHQNPCRNYTRCFTIPYGRYDDRKSSSGHASTLPIYRGNGDHFHYLCKCQ